MSPAYFSHRILAVSWMCFALVRKKLAGWINFSSSAVSAWAMFSGVRPNTLSFWHAAYVTAVVCAGVLIFSDTIEIDLYWTIATLLTIFGLRADHQRDENVKSSRFFIFTIGALSTAHRVDWCVAWLSHDLDVIVHLLPVCRLRFRYFRCWRWIWWS